MPNRLLLEFAARPAVKRLITSSSLARPVVERFVAGTTVDDAVAAARSLKPSGIAAVLDHLGEHVGDGAQADAAAEGYLALLDRIASERLDAHISVKLTQLGLVLSADGARERLEAICSRAVRHSNVVAIDMESHPFTAQTIETYRRIRASGYDNVVLCLQAYLRRTVADVESLIGLRPAIRLCKGAYNEPRDIRLGPQQTRASFRTLLVRLLRACPYTAVATHDGLLVREAMRQARRRAIPRERYEFQLLYGVRRDLQTELVAAGFAVRVYVPFGEQWFAYLMRRLAERPANLRLLLEAIVRG